MPEPIMWSMNEQPATSSHSESNRQQMIAAAFAGVVLVGLVVAGAVFWSSGDERVATVPAIAAEDADASLASPGSAVPEGLAFDEPLSDADVVNDAATLDGDVEPTPTSAAPTTSGVEPSDALPPEPGNGAAAVDTPSTTSSTSSASTSSQTADTSNTSNSSNTPNAAVGTTTDVDGARPSTTNTSAAATAATNSTSTPTSTAPASQPTTTTTSTTTTTTSTTAAPAAVTRSGPIRSGALYTDPYNSAAQWAKNNASDSRASIIGSRIGNTPMANWFGDWNANISADVSNYVQRARSAGAVPMLVAYNVPERDCGQHSSGGAANAGAYESWIAQFTNGLGNGDAIILLEPDSLALNCVGSARNAIIANAVVTIKNGCGGCRVYLDAGHSSWVAPTDMAGRLVDAGVLNADGFYTNVSNYNATSNEEAFGRQVLSALGNPAGLGQVVDVSRNGNGANGEWCDPAGRAIGVNPSLNPSANVHAHLWVKVPGEADGCVGAAGQFVPQRAYELATD